MTRTLDKTHTVLSYVEGSLKNAIVMNEDVQENGFIFSLINPPVPLGGNIVSLDIYVDELPLSKKSIQIATSDTIVNASALSETRPIQFKPFQSARFLVIGMELDNQKKHKITIMSKLEGFEQIIIPFTFVDYTSKKKEKVIISSNLPEESDTQIYGETMFMNFASPLVLSGRKAYIVCSSNGALSANWTWMGARYDNGGLYVPPARAFGRIIVEISVDEGVRKRLPNFVVSSRHENGSLCTHHEVAGIRVKRTLFVPIENKGFVQILNFDLEKIDELNTLNSKKQATKKIRVHFLIDGNITSYGLAAISQSNFSRYYKSENCLQIRTIAKKGVAHYFGTIGISPKNLKPSKILTDSFDNDLELSYDIELQEGLTKEIALIGAGDFTSAQDCLTEYKNNIFFGVPSPTKKEAKTACAMRCLDWLMADDLLQTLEKPKPTPPTAPPTSRCSRASKPSANALECISATPMKEGCITASSRCSITPSMNISRVSAARSKSLFM